VLAFFRASARPFAALVFVHWASTQFVWRLFGDAVYAYLAPRDIALGVIGAWLAWRRPSWSRSVIVLCLAAMSLAHVAYWTALAGGVYAGGAYMDTLNALFGVILISLGASAGGWLVANLRARMGPDHSSVAPLGAKRR